MQAPGRFRAPSRGRPRTRWSLHTSSRAFLEDLARAPQSVKGGMNQFLKGLDVTFRRDLETGRPRINKLDSVVDKEQKKAGEYFYMGEAPR